MTNCPHLYETRKGCPLCRREDAKAAELLRQEGEALALDNKPEWVAMAEEAMRQLAGSGRPFTAEDLVNLVGLPGTGMLKSNAVGAIFSRWSKANKIKQVGTAKATRPSSHQATLRVWAGFRNEEALNYKQGNLL